MSGRDGSRGSVSTDLIVPNTSVRPCAARPESHLSAAANDSCVQSCQRLKAYSYLFRNATRLNLSPELSAVLSAFFAAVRQLASRSAPMEPEASSSMTTSFGTTDSDRRGVTMSLKYLHCASAQEAAARLTNFSSGAASATSMSSLTASFSRSTIFSSTFSYTSCAGTNFGPVFSSGAAMRARSTGASAIFGTSIGFASGAPNSTGIENSAAALSGGAVSARLFGTYGASVVGSGSGASDSSSFSGLNSNCSTGDGSDLRSGASGTGASLSHLRSDPSGSFSACGDTGSPASAFGASRADIMSLIISTLTGSSAGS